MERHALRISAVCAALGVIIGAFGAHGLKDVLSPYGLAIYEKAVFYHLSHAVAMVALAVSPALPPKTRSLALSLFLVGILLFSGSLYLLAVTEIRWLGAITPLGGTAFISGWGVLAWRGVHAEPN